MMSLLSSAAQDQARERLARLAGPVVLRVAPADAGMRALAGDLIALTADELLTLEEGEGEGLRLLDGWGRETGIVFRDPPVGQEFPVLLDAILAVSRGGSLLSPLGRSQASSLPEGATLQVFVTPT